MILLDGRLPASMYQTRKRDHCPAARTARRRLYHVGFFHNLRSVSGRLHGDGKERVLASRPDGTTFTAGEPGLAAGGVLRLISPGAEERIIFRRWAARLLSHRAAGNDGAGCWSRLSYQYILNAMWAALVGASHRRRIQRHHKQPDLEEGGEDQPDNGILFAASAVAKTKMLPAARLPERNAPSAKGRPSI